MTATYRTSLEIPASRDVLFGYFTKPELMLGWIGDHAVLDARPGGEFTLDIQGIPVRGRYLEVSPPTRVVVSWGHAGSDTLPPESTRVEFTLTSAGPDRTVVAIEHHDLPTDHAQSHSVGWPMFLNRLADLTYADA